jgi:FlaG/FlaF family flagellin (archaellin)
LIIAVSTAGIFDGDERAISPVVGGALLIVIVVLLATVTGAIALDIADDEPPAPTTRLELDSVQSCKFQLVHRGGDEIDGDRITVQGIQNPDALTGRHLTAEDGVPVTPSNDTVRVVWNAPDDDTDHVLREFNVDLTATTGLTCSAGTVLTRDSNGRIRVLTPNEDPITLSATSNLDALGNTDVDVTDDGRTDVPFVTGGDEVAITNGTNETTILASSSDITGTIQGSKTRLAAGSWNGHDDSVYFVNENHDTIYRVEPGESPTVVATPGDGAQAVLGPGDADGDGDSELLFADSSQHIQYVEPNGGGVEKVDDGGVGSNNGIGSGAVADFDGDGTVTVVTIDGSNDLKLVSEPTSQGGDGTRTISSVDAAKSPTTVADVDDDGDSEVLYVSTGGYLKYVDDVTGSPTTAFVRDTSGDKIEADDASGVV